MHLYDTMIEGYYVQEENDYGGGHGLRAIAYRQVLVREW